MSMRGCEAAPAEEASVERIIRREVIDPTRLVPAAKEAFIDSLYALHNQVFAGVTREVTKLVQPFPLLQEQVEQNGEQHQSCSAF